jgi:hypothetical protein
MAGYVKVSIIRMCNVTYESTLNAIRLNSDESPFCGHGFLKYFNKGERKVGFVLRNGLQVRQKFGQKYIYIYIYISIVVWLQFQALE